MDAAASARPQFCPRRYLQELGVGRCACGRCSSGRLVGAVRAPHKGAVLAPAVSVDAGLGPMRTWEQQYLDKAAVLAPVVS